MTRKFGAVSETITDKYCGNDVVSIVRKDLCQYRLVGPQKNDTHNFHHGAHKTTRHRYQ